MQTSTVQILAAISALLETRKIAQQSLDQANIAIAEQAKLVPEGDIPILQEILDKGIQES